MISFYKANSRRFCHDLSTVKTRNILCDHTFKCAANIGRKRRVKWIKLIDSIFIVISGEGLVRDFKLTRGTGFEQVRDTLQNIAKDCIDIDNIYIGNCCQWRQLLKDIFPMASVKLDIFHAIQRPFRKVSNKHPFYSDFTKEFGLIVRQGDEFGQERKNIMSGPESIMKNIDRFLDKWNTVQYKGWFTLTNGFQQEI